LDRYGTLFSDVFRKKSAVKEREREIERDRVAPMKEVKVRTTSNL
jgi:hypothetical protein